MKNLTLLLLLFSTFLSFSQNDKKETVYLLFDTSSKEKCKVDVEGKGYLNLNKYRTKTKGNIKEYLICNETFSIRENTKSSEKLPIQVLDTIKVRGIKYLKQKHKSSKKFKHNIFEKIYLLEKTSDNKIIKYDVVWMDDLVLTD